MRRNSVLNTALARASWFAAPGAYVVVDGQYGSTGKGLLNSALAAFGLDRGEITHVTSNAGPNSGHTAYSPVNDQKIMTQQLPTTTVVAEHMGVDVTTLLNAGAVIDPEYFLAEFKEHIRNPLKVTIHPNAAVIERLDIETEARGSVAKVASTGKGTGSAIARKILRQNNVADKCKPLVLFVQPPDPWDWTKDVAMVEVSQGFSLGINQRFYPYTTSRECTVQQALSDANIPARRLRKVAACYRSFPIRVGNTDLGYSGPIYSDQEETTWEAIGQLPEFTTVTKRVRRVFTWSWLQFTESLRANEPDLVFLNFAQYIKDKWHLTQFLLEIEAQYRVVMGRPLETLLVGFGPRIEDIGVFKDGKIFASVRETV